MCLTKKFKADSQQLLSFSTGTGGGTGVEQSNLTKSPSTFPAQGLLSETLGKKNHTEKQYKNEVAFVLSWPFSFARVSFRPLKVVENTESFRVETIFPFSFFLSINFLLKPFSILQLSSSRK